MPICALAASANHWPESPADWGLLHPLGEVGQIVFLRLMAFILLSVGVQIVWEGVRALLASL